MPGRRVGDRPAPADDVVLEIALELDAIVAERGETSGERTDLVERAMPRPGADANPRLDLSAQQIHQRQVVQLGEGVPNRTFKPVVLAAMGNR